MSDLWQELQEDMAQQRLAEIWKKHGNFIIALALAIVVGTAGGVAWREWQHHRQAEASSALLQGLQAAQVEDYANAETLLDTVKATRQRGIRDIATSAHASILLNRHSPEEAMAEFSAVAESPDNFWSHYGRLMAGYIALQFGLKHDVAAAPGESEPLYASLLEQRAWSLAAAGKRDEAMAAFAQLKDATGTPATLHERAQMAWAYLSASGHGQ